MSDDAAGHPITQVPEGPPEYPSNPSLDRSAELSTSPDARTGIMKRAMGKTADRLSRSRSAGKQTPSMTQSSPALPVSGHRRIFSLNRSKGKEKASTDDDLTTAQSQLVASPTSPSLPRRLSGRSTVAAQDDDSPFITPRSPPFGPTRSVFNIFRGDGSLRAGTQTLIQALQAIPWAGDDQDNDEDAANQETTDPESDDEDKPASWLASSIHTIYRPVARSRRKDRAARSRTEPQRMPSLSDAEDEPTPEEPVLSDEDIEEDFEPQSFDLHQSSEGQSTSMTLPPLPELDPPERSSIKPVPARSGSMATVKIQRRARLAEKLRDIFELKGISETKKCLVGFYGRFGYMYLTDSYLCFFAHLPSREDQVLKSGSLSKRAQRTKRWIKHWFTLKNDVLSWYQSSSDPYFPKGVVDLRYAISCDSVGEKDIRLRTNQKTIRLSADSVPSRDEWVKAIRKVMFKAQNMGDSVKIAIPYSAIVDIERSSAMDFSETIEVKVVDKGESYSVDSYFFAYFHDLQAALEQIRDAVRSSRGVPGDVTPPSVIDTTVSRSPPVTPNQTDKVAWASSPDSIPRASGFRFTSLLKPLQDSLPMSRTASAPEPIESPEEFTHVTKRSSTTFVPITTSPKSSFRLDSPPAARPSLITESSSSSVTPTASYISTHTYPPSSSLSPSISETGHSASSNTSTWSVGVPSWLKMPSTRRLLTSPFSSLSSRPSTDHAATLPASGSAKVTEVLSQSYLSPSSTSRPFSGEFGFYSILEAPGFPMDSDIVEKFRSSFAFDEKETLLGYFPGYIFRLLPVYGRLYISTNYFAFKSSGPLTSRTRMILPLRDILSTESSKAFRFGHYGLVVIVRGHEELFFEFADEERRTAFVSLLEKQSEDALGRAAAGEAHHTRTEGQRDALILEEFGPRAQITESEVMPEPENLDGSLPAVMFTSTSSTFLTFKPKEPLHLTFLTIGSRGDVQPYIALAKGLIADGHKCRIATHGEFKEWIEAHGIEFGYVGGDPAELMRICVENGMFTVSFLKESMAKQFRGWIDDLLKTSWEACQGTDVLVESPSAMGGYHIAEALRIPYFRAFTMTWSRTRAYPHAFAVPEHKMGGNYNYMSYVLFDQVFWRGTAGQINRWRRNTLGLPSTSLDKMEPHKIPFLYNFSPVVVPPPLDWPEWIRVCGYWFLDDANVGAAKWSPPPDLLEFIETAHKAKRKVVYIGFGSIVVSDPKAMTRTVVEAIVQSGVYAILSKGWSDRLVKTATTEVAEVAEPLPKQIYQISSIPHDWLFKRIDAACHHGGAGTTGASLRAGIPTIIKPFFGDQFFWADRVEALGIGSAVRKLTVPHLTEALIAATTDQKQIDRAKMIGENIRAENGVATAIEAIYRDLEYAKTLIKGHAIASEHREEASDPEHSTIRSYRGHSPARTGTHSGNSSFDSTNRGAVSDWSVISDSEEASAPTHS
ncbi:Sterol 3-beta-glucosyltransferase [Steccherinum ochraceum]|uniref:sterol 3beta-glucosyltransferase n=1 Tax=Steccherinum ochraceum TaxID=92696 RepID=A0A4R0RPL0_9APHY|nr:Sterol 3-beta-glucosyltransferase [Steccherinum ochraceum]